MAVPLVKTSRPPLERMLRIHEELRHNRPINCTRLCEQLEVNRKTIIRDIAFMRERLDLPVEFDRSAQTYRYLKPVEVFPTVQVTEGELLALLVARRALEQYQGTPFHHQLEIAFEKLTNGLRDRITFSPADELATVSFKNVGLGKADLTIFNLLSAAVLNHHEVEFDYRKPGDKTATRRRVRPYHLSHRENLWYLIGHDALRDKPITFALPRISAARKLNKTFVRPVDFDPSKFFSSALGVLVGDGNHTVKIRFTPAVADRIRERVWHETQELRDLPDGGVELTLRLGALAEVERWVLGWGAEAEVVAPAALRRTLARTARTLLSVYQTR